MPITVVVNGNTATVYSKRKIKRILLALAVLADRVDHLSHDHAHTYYAGDLAIAVHFGERRNRDEHLICSTNLLP